MTPLITSIVADRLDRMSSMANDALQRGSDLVELRLDALREGEFSESNIKQYVPPGRWIATCRPVREGGSSRAAVEHRLFQLLACLRAGAAYIDFEYVDWQRLASARHDIIAALADPLVAEHAPGLIISYHDFERCPPNLQALADEMSAVENASAIKLAWRGDGVLSSFNALDLMHATADDLIAIAMGDSGLLSRVLAAKLGAFASYAALDEDSAAAPGQLTLGAMRDRFRWESITPSTEVYGVIGYPVAHSLSPDVFNQAFAQAHVGAVYLPMLVEPTYEAFEEFVDGCCERDWLDVRGFSVTLPHKVHALKYLGDRVDPPADLIGAVNTIRIEDGEAWGCNTDCDAAIDTLIAGMACDDEDLHDLPVDVLGAGGVARAVAAGLTDCGARVTVYNRDADRARALADRIECKIRPWEDRLAAEGKILVNCTSVGMWPDVDASPLPSESHHADCAVFDTVYHPRETRLLADARAAGCRVIDGLGMFIRQAAMQFEYWTQQAADYETLTGAVVAAIDPKTDHES